MKIIITLVRILVGLLFIFSGLVKANDPAGLSYKMREFFEAWGMQSLNNLALIFSVLMIAFEIIAGAALLLGWLKKWNLWFLLGLIIFFTFLTGYAWLSGKFKACGCFGDCIPLTPNQSFFKDVLLLLLIVFLFLFQKYIKPVFSNKWIQYAIMGVVILFSFGVQKYTLDHLPFKDCLSFKVGNNILEKKKFQDDKKEIVMVYRKAGKEFRFTLPNYPEWVEDSTYEFVKREEKILKKGNSGDIIFDFAMNSESGNDSTREILSQKGEVFLFLITDISPDGSYGWENNFKKLAQYTAVKTDPEDADTGLAQQVINGHLSGPPLYILSNQADAARLFFKKYGVAPNHIFFCDEKPLLAAARTRPALMVLNEGVIMKKISYKDIGVLLKSWKGE